MQTLVHYDVTINSIYHRDRRLTHLVLALLLLVPLRHVRLVVPLDGGPLLRVAEHLGLGLEHCTVTLLISTQDHIVLSSLYFFISLTSRSFLLKFQNYKM